MKDELQKHKKSDTLKWIATLLAVVLLALGVLTAITQGFTDFDPYGWFQKETTPTGGALDESGNELGKDVAEMPRALKFRNAASLADTSMYDSVTLHATVKPDNADNKTVDWAATFLNAESDWAQGKEIEEYISITPESDGSTTAEVKCLQPFGEQIIITVKSRDNENATAQCTVDFAKRLRSHKLTLAQAANVFGSFDYVTETLFTGDFAIMGPYTLNPGERIYTDYTVNDTIKITVYEKVNEQILNQFKTDTGAEAEPFAAAAEDWKLGDLVVDQNNTQMPVMLGSFTACLTYGETSAMYNINAINILNGWLRTHTDQELFSFVVTAAGEYSETSYTVPVRFTSSGLKYKVTGVELDDTDLLI